MHALPEILENAFHLALTASAKAALLAVLVGMVCLLGGRWLSPAWRHGLWTLVFLRLAMPDVPVGNGQWALSRWVTTREPTKLTRPLAPARQSPAVRPMGDGLGKEPEFPYPAAPVPVQGIEPRSFPKSSVEIRVSERKETHTPAVKAVAAAPTKVGFSTTQILSIVWASGVILWMAALAYTMGRFRRRLRDAAPASKEIQDLLERCLAEAGISRRVRLCVSSREGLPAVCGWWRPVIILPRSVVEALSLHEIRLLLLHEIGHLKRQDIPVQIAVSLLLGMHWFNPLLWFAQRMLRRESEEATDAWVLRHAGREESVHYGGMLLSLANRSATAALALAFLPSLIGAGASHRQMRQRIEGIAHFRPGRRWRMIPAGMPAMGLAMVGFSQAPSTMPRQEKKDAPEKAHVAETPAKPSTVADVALPLPADVKVAPDAIGGFIVDEQGKPVANAKIEIRVHLLSKDKAVKDSYKKQTVTTDAGGHWTAPNVPAQAVPETSHHNGEGKDVYRFYITHPDFLYLECSSMGPVFGVDREFRQQTAKIVLPRGHILRGRVTDEKGQPVAGAKIERCMELFDDPSTTTDAEGHYLLKAARHGPYNVRVRAKGYSQVQQPVGVFEETTQDFVLKPAHTLTLRVLDEKGLPITEGYVNFHADTKERKRGDRLRWLNLDKEGRVVWDEAPDTPLMIYAEGSGYQGVTKKVTAGEEIVIRLKPKDKMPTFELHITDASTGQPVTNCTITTGLLWASRHSDSPNDASWLTDETSEKVVNAGKGVYRELVREDYVKNRYLFSISAEGYVPFMTGPQKPADAAKPVSIQLKPKSEALLQVIQANGKPAAKADVYVLWRGQSLELNEGFKANRERYHNRDLEAAVQADEQGRFRLPPAADDAAVLAVHDGGYASTTYGELVKENVIQLSSYGRVEANVKKPDGSVAAGAAFEYQGAMSLPGQRYVMLILNVTADAQGHISLPRVFPAKRAHLSEVLPPAREGESSSRIMAKEYKEVMPEQVTTFVLTSSAGGARTLKGQLTVNGVPVKSDRRRSLGLFLAYRTGNEAGNLAGTTHADEEGHFEFHGITPGGYTLMISNDKRYAMAEDRMKRLEVPPVEAGHRTQYFDIGNLELRDFEAEPVLKAPEGKVIFHMRVQNHNGKPIAGATVRFNAARLDTQRGDAYSQDIFDLPQEIKPVETNAEGFADIVTPAQSRDGAKVIGMQTGVSAPGYVGTYAAEAVSNRQSTFVLENAAQLSVKVLNHGKAVTAGAMVQINRSGRDVVEMVADAASEKFVSNDVRPGPAFVQAACKTPEGTLLFSKPMAVLPDLRHPQEVSLDLKPGIRVAGRVDDSVPRPIRNARIAVVVTPLPGDEHGEISWTDAQPLREDGAFEFASLPQGRMHVLVLADGWISELRSMGAMIPRPFDLGVINESRGDVLIPMVRTVSCEVTVLDNAGQPKSGMQVVTWPNINKTGAGNWILDIFEPRLADFVAGPKPSTKDVPYWRTYGGTTNADGKAFITQLPAGDRQTINIFPAGVDLKKAQTGAAEVITDELKPDMLGKVTVRIK